MTSIIKKSSGVLPWTIDEIEKIPAEKGVYVLRNLPTQNGIVLINYTDNLKQTLKEAWELKSTPETAWFDWYEVGTKEYGQDLLKKWIVKYSPKYNL
mgnify:CR=1 FL=1